MKLRFLKEGENQGNPRFKVTFILRRLCETGPISPIKCNVPATFMLTQSKSLNVLIVGDFHFMQLLFTSS